MPAGTGIGDGENWDGDEGPEIDSDDGGEFESAHVTSRTSAPPSEEQKRTYHHDGTYLIPNDELEQDRLALQNQLWHLTLDGKLHLAPLETPPRRVLDIGCGTGTWVIEFAQKHPYSHVTGFDISAIQPKDHPANVSFLVADAEKPWPFTYSFTYIHGRALMSGGFHSMPSLFASAFAALSPGGIFEMQDGCMPFSSADGSLNNTALLEWGYKTLEGSAKVGRKFAYTKAYKRLMETVGFVDVREKRLKWPLGTWPKDEKLKKIGALAKEDMKGILGAVKKVFTTGLGWSEEGSERLIGRARMELEDKRIHAWVDM